MPMSYESRNYAIFELVGSVYKQHNLPLEIRRKLGFIIINEIDEFISSLVISNFEAESDHRLDEDKSINEMLDELRDSDRVGFGGLSRNQMLGFLIEQLFDERKEEVENRRSVQILLNNTVRKNIHRQSEDSLES